MKLGQLVAVVLVLIAVPGRVIGSGGDRSAQLRFASSRAGEVVVPVHIGGRGPFRFILDTGSSHTAVSDALTAALGAEPVAKAPVSATVGTMMRIVVRLTDVTVGSAHVDSLLATSVPADPTGILGNDASGILGQDFLSQFDYTIDYRSRRLLWNDDGRREQGMRLALEPSEGRFLVRLPQDAGCRCAVRMVPDSGADGFVLFTGTDADRLPVDAGVDAVRVTTLAGEGIARAVVLKALRVGPARLWNQPAARVTRPQGGADEGDGLLPLHLFARVSFNHHEGYMTVER